MVSYLFSVLPQGQLDSALCGTWSAGEIGSVCVFCGGRIASAGSDTVKMMRKSAVSDSHGTACRAELQREAPVGNC